MKTELDGKKVVFQVTTLDYMRGRVRAGGRAHGGSYWQASSPEGHPFVVVVVDKAGPGLEPPTLVVAHWDGVSDQWKAEGYDPHVGRLSAEGSIDAAMKLAGWGEGANNR